MTIILKIRLFNELYRIYYIEEPFLPLEIISVDPSLREFGSKSNKSIRYMCSAYFLHIFLKVLYDSQVYRRNVTQNMHRLSETCEEDDLILHLRLKPPEREIIDYAWNDRILRLVWSRIEIENAFSWLSTLGGAYSALGDTFQYCAEEAGRISVRQYKLSCLLGDDGLAARSQVYAALSYSQRGNLKIARHIIRHVAKFSRQIHDIRLLRMCQGVWAKLKYLRGKQKMNGEVLSSNLALK